MLNFVENLLENERDPRSGPMNDQDHSLSLSDPDRSLVLSHFLTNFLQNLASCQTSLRNMPFKSDSPVLGHLYVCIFTFLNLPRNLTLLNDDKFYCDNYTILLNFIF
jgi:hypothetical protein